MFEPPSPPPAGSGDLEEPPCEESPESLNVQSGGSGLGSKLGCQFTFAMSRNVSFNPPTAPGGHFIQAQSTPNPPPRPAAPMTDPRLRLFQFQYDTFTRDHLSAMVDSIAINSPSGQTFSSGGQSPLLQGLSRVSEDAGGAVEGDSLSRMRSAKRIKLSPRSDFHGEGAGADAVISRPKLQGRDYVGESRSLMQKIKQARDFSTISTTVSAQDSPRPPTDPQTSDQDARLGKSGSLDVPPNGSTSSTDTSVNSRSGTAYRQQAEALMAQIRGDVKGQKRLFSGDTDATVTTRLDNSTDTTHTSVRLKGGKDDPKDSSLRLHRSNSSYSTSSSSRSRNSPRRASNPRSRVVTVGRLTDDVLRMSLRESRTGAPEVTITPPTIVSTSSEPLLASPRIPPSYPAFSIRSATNDDLNRFVSSSTASGTTMTSGTAPSFVKHSGPAQIRTIAPQDVPTLPDKVGKMIFDKVLMKWVKNPAFGTSVVAEEDVAASPEADGESEDPFRDIESLDDSRIRDHHDGHHTSRRHIDVDADDAMSKIEEVSEVDGEEAELTSFSFDDPTGGIVPVMTGVESGASDGGEYDESSDSDDDHEVVPVGIPGDEYDTEEDLRPAEESLAEAESDMRYSIESMAVVAVVVSPLRRPKPSPQASTPGLRSVLKSTTATPVSAMKDPSRHRTPAQRHRRRRSVSFSDGKRDGPIRGLCRTTDDDSVGSNIVAYSTVNHNDHTRNDAPGFVPSARSKRIADLLQGLESDTGSDDNESPTKTSTSERPDEIQPLRSREPNSAAASSTMGDNGRREFSQTSKHALSPARLHRGTSGNATFLTECSFGVAHDRLVQVITDVQPFEPHWEELSHIDLSDKKIESVARLKEFLPHLDSLHLNSNQLSWLSGVPSSVRTLSVASNSLTALSSFGHLLNLENLDISKNDIDSLRQLSCLRHLRELRADANKIGSIDGLERMDGLVKLSLEGNIIRSVDLDQCRWTRLEMLNLSHNRLDNISGLASLPSLIALNVDNNLLNNLEFGSSMPRMRILRLSGNRIRELNVALTPNLRTLYADNNSLISLVKVDRLTKLENLSLRNQSGRGLNLRTRDIRDVKRLYLSGNPLRTACRLTALPAEMGRMVPNLRVLNLNYNFLEDVSGLGGLGRLRKLTVIGSRLKSTKPVVKMLQGMPDVEMLDFRMNPCTLGWYLPLLVKDVPGALQPSDRPSHSDSNTALAVASSSHQPQTTASSSSSSSSREWHDLDTKFRRDLPDEAYIGRLAYRGLVMRVCPRVRMLDGVEVGEKERRKAGLVLKGLMASTSASASASTGAAGGATKGKQKEKETQREVGKEKEKEGKGKSS
ncbi:hypothetical protein ONZ45_g2183 [Pleurotus djamor]|nr:hypothetical protein ONZ45_g2183 [Pleurotus djamor]